MTGDINTTTDVETLRTALERGDHEEVLRGATRLQAASVEELLDDLEATLNDAQYDDAELLFEGLINRYETQRSIENARATATRRAQRQPSVSFSEQRELAGVLRTLTATRLKRAQLVSSLAEFLDAPDQSEQTVTDVTARVSETKSQESTLNDEQATGASVTDDVTLPATLAIVEFSLTPDRVESGETTTARVVVENVGDERATSVAATVSTPSDATVQFQFGDIQAGETTEGTAELSPTGTGSQTLSVTVTDDSGTTKSASQTVSVLRDAPEESGVGRFDQNDTGQIEAQEVLNAISAYNSGDQIGGADVSARDVINLIAAYNSGQSV